MKTLKEKIEVMQAADRGEKIECKDQCIGGPWKDKSDILAGRQLVVDGNVQAGDIIVFSDASTLIIDNQSPWIGLSTVDEGWRAYRVMPVAKNLDRDDPPAPKPNVCHEAETLVLGDRNASYGNPGDDYAKTAKIWSGIIHPILKRDITPQEAILMMVGVKLSREAHKHKHDNIVDAIGYLLCLDWSINGKPDITPCTTTPTDTKNLATTTTPKSCDGTCKKEGGCCENGESRTEKNAL